MENDRKQDWILGPNAVGEALTAGRRTVFAIYRTGGRGGRKVEELLAAAQSKGVPVKEVSRRELEHLCGSLHHQGIAAQVGGLPPLSLEDWWESRMDAEALSLVVVLDGVEDPHNLGAVMRSALAFGAQAVIAPRDRAAGASPAAMKAAAGAWEYLPLISVTNLARSLDYLKDKGLWTIGAVASSGENIHSADLTGPLAVVLGGEHRGLRRLTQEKCDRLVMIPMAAEVSSLNVAAAAAVLLYEINKQRTQTR